MRGRRLKVIALLVLGIGGFTLVPEVAGAQGVYISTYASGGTICRVDLNTDFCLYYSIGLHGAYYGRDYSVPVITSAFFGGAGLPGYGQLVRNNAASLANNTGSCDVGTWVYPTYVGPYNWTSQHDAGNLTTTGTIVLRNNEASVLRFACL